MTPDDIDKALQNVSKDVRKAWDEVKELTGITDADLYDTPIGKTLLMGDVAKQCLGKLMASFTVRLRGFQKMVVQHELT